MGYKLRISLVVLAFSPLGLGACAATPRSPAVVVSSVEDADALLRSVEAKLDDPKAREYFAMLDEYEAMLISDLTVPALPPASLVNATPSEAEGLSASATPPEAP